jgi:hypothetical protein
LRLDHALFIAKSNNDAALASLFDRRPTDLLLVALCGRWLFELLDELKPKRPSGSLAGWPFG